MVYARWPAHGQAASQTGLATAPGLLRGVCRGARQRACDHHPCVYAEPACRPPRKSPRSPLSPSGWWRHSGCRLTATWQKGCLILSYVSSTCGKMVLSGGCLAQGILEKQAGVPCLEANGSWRFCPRLPTILASWLTMRWLYPPKHRPAPDDTSWHDLLRSLGPWTRDERKCWVGYSSPSCCGPRTSGIISALPPLGSALACSSFY